jgi:hypothetical protein
MRVYFNLADAIATVDHAAASTPAQRTEQDHAEGVPAGPAVLLTIDTEVYLASDSQHQPGTPRPFTAKAHGLLDANDLRQTAGAHAGMRLHYQLPADGNWVTLGRHALRRGYDLLTVNLPDMSLGIGRRRTRTTRH